MRPILLKGHERSITYLMYNREGDLIFTCSKDSRPTVWYSSNGERLGTYDGHTGTVWSLDVTSATEFLVTGSADTTARLWDVRTGDELARLSHDAPVRGVKWAPDGLSLATITIPFMRRPASIRIYGMPGSPTDVDAPLAEWEIEPKRIMRVVDWMPTGEQLITGHDEGELRLWDVETGKLASTAKSHSGPINALRWSKDKSLFITASGDQTAKLWDTKSMTVIKTYQSDRPVNSAAISPTRDHVVTGGGQDAMSVTTTAGRVGKFEAKFYSLVFEEEFGRVKGHFGPINTISFSPDGTGFASGAEDGYIRLHHFDASYDTMAKTDFDSLSAAAVAARERASAVTKPAFSLDDAGDEESKEDSEAA